MKIITQRELRKRSAELLREVEGGQLFTITIGGRPIAQLVPYQPRQWVRRAEVIRLLRSGDPDPEFFADIAEMGKV